MDSLQPSSIDPAKLNALLQRAVEDLSAGYGGVMMSLGHRLGLYKAMAGAGPLSPRELSGRTGCAERYVTEWLNAQVAGGYVAYHAISGTYELTPERAFVLADDSSPAFMPHAWAVPASMWFDEDKAVEAFRSGKGIPWGDHDGRLHCGVAGFYRNAYRGSLVQEWLPKLDGAVSKLQAGSLVADVEIGRASGRERVCQYGKISVCAVSFKQKTAYEMRISDWSSDVCSSDLHAWAVPASMWFDEDKAVEAFRSGKGIPWGDHDGRLHCGVAGFYRNAYRGSLVQEWLPKLDGAVSKLQAGALVADVGCGHGHSTVLMGSEERRVGKEGGN